ncbi:hypothetical protein HJC23_011970 [Cyclotella cryptica]|uniref:Uncharacterized protein n=1 Tax=Cyclotella cryptica TaxID=29204 RepID=A0ABD3QUF6_9STRA|eukprot:CCRYP_003010-RA/>CCRYP_003010-RA protein AED:0.06 eAED:0.06 QI:0/-1/0/1/-1/1/1/0/290
MKPLIMMIALSSITPLKASSCCRAAYPDTFSALFDSMAIFEDSFSDVGNIRNRSNGSEPGIWSFNGRYSDGRVWIEYILQFFNLPLSVPSAEGGLNYAYGGATVNNTYIHSFSTYLDANVPSVSNQITQYLDDEGEILPRDRLHVLFAGYNDYWWYIYRNYTISAGHDWNLTNVYINVANDIVDQVQTLYNKGARIFLVGNIPNMSTWAEAALQSQEVLASYDVLVRGHNRLLSQLLSEFEERYEDATMYQFDAFRTFDCLDKRKTFFGVQNIHNACHPTRDENCGEIFS